MELHIVKNFIDNAYHEAISDKYYDVYNPAFGEVIARVPETPREEIDRAIESSVNAFERWSKVPVTERIKYLFRLHELIQNNIDEIAKTTTNEHGKIFNESKGDVIRTLENIEAASAEVYHMMGKNNTEIATNIDEFMIRVPIGVFAIISPFNFPLMVPFWFVPYAVATGNTVIVKPSEKTPLSMELVGELIRKAGFPEGVINIINGGSDVVNRLLDSKEIKGVGFVGTTGVAQYVYKKASESYKRVIANGSAKNFAIVMPDANLSQTIPNLISSFFGNAGERCLANSVLITFKENHDKVVSEFARASSKIRLGYGLDKDVDMGPLIREEHRQKVKSYIDYGKENKIKLIIDGSDKVPEKYKKGFFLGPTIFDEVPLDSKLIKEEIFGPVASVIVVDNFDEALNIINSSKYGNAGSIFTESGYYARRFANEVNAGNIGINIGIAAPLGYYPFGGMKDSFFGMLHAQGGEDHIMFYTERKIIINRWFGYSEKEKETPTTLK
ncbi:methylmalonic acid semialdehyde dehydrogenase [Caldisphaera lagunensis DSM 15908]|uniref:methylmalonate-semialdehyde dehydrogenase (CoA acylating) n=1 Tax=Caldisphaera lagunensis (strain DSM 15908 / JCM 11604 / ANMR 0165 / IC-154) TaxID=1056495 RepID=L0AAA1_CALLD|nr:CoA-acylating methylmalonate-semialdehyde dehydrogenase [Caldisphaera lagunensis]AFZ69970.1 methylmalonic acid semialdehyde dehydrogenase [Caldisphaera lagunensis DSM 15908]